MESGILPPRMHDPNDFEFFGAHPVNQFVISVRNGLARSLYAPSPAQIRPLTQSARASPDRRMQPNGGRRIAIRNIFDNRFGSCRAGPRHSRPLPEAGPDCPPIGKPRRARWCRERAKAAWSRHFRAPDRRALRTASTSRWISAIDSGVLPAALARAAPSSRRLAAARRISSRSSLATARDERSPAASASRARPSGNSRSIFIGKGYARKGEKQRRTGVRALICKVSFSGSGPPRSRHRCFLAVIFGDRIRELRGLGANQNSHECSGKMDAGSSPA